MATQHTFPESATDAFKTAIQSFKKTLNNDKLYAQILQTSSIEQVYDMTDQLQKEQSKQHRLRNLAKVKPYLDRLDAYTGAIDTFVQAKPDILALIWGPIKLLIQWASVLSKSLDALIDMAAQIGYLLPKFGHAKRMFGDSDQIDLLLALFFQDILDFYSVALKFFTMPRESNGVLSLGCQLLEISDDAHSSSGWNLMFEAVWPKKKPEIEHIINRVGRHAAMLGTEVGLEHIQAAYEARTTDLEHFRKVHLRTKHTEYSILETAMAPTFYDKNLYELQDRLCEGTGDWILKHPTMQNWLDFRPEESGSIPRIVWLRGIPGAGKTFLAVCLIQKLRSMYREPNHVVFAILTHSLSVSTTSLSIFHSLIFQLARDHHLMSKGQPEEHESVLQDFICETDRGTLASSLDAATELLIKLLQLSGPVHIVIDGLDEIDERQRLHFLVQILTVSQSCPETRILIASRDEADIKAELESNATAIRADNCNASSIRHYVTVRCNQWIKAHNFSQEENQEIAVLLEPIAIKAQGMFMYAELILKGLDFLDGIDEIREELKVLPTDLKAAYGRIFSRINEQLPTEYLREKARKILGWVGCSPVPLTIQELDQALSIKVGDFCQIPGAYSTLKIVHLCGPVVEIVDNEVHFVHFTAKEYFFDSRISSHLSTARYTLSLANVCITYLCQPHHDPTLDHGTIARHLWKGAYRLHHFAVCEWFNLIKACCLFKELDKRSESWRQLPRLLEQLLKTRANNSFRSAGETAPLLLENAETLGPEVYELLCQEARFLKDSEMRLFTISKGEHLTFDPLKLRCTTVAVNRALEERICPLNAREPESTSSAPCLQGLQDFNFIQLNYGTKLFKCPFVSCALYRNGYEDVKLRQSHAKDHQRPWRCEIPACEYSEIGFLSRRMRDEHLDQFHCVDHSGESVSLRDKEVSEEDFSFASALIRANKVEIMRTWIKQYAGDIPRNTPYLNWKRDLTEKEQVWQALLTELASSGSVEMLQDVLGQDVRVFAIRNLCNIILNPAIASANLGIVEWIAANYKSPHSSSEHYSATLALAFQVENFHAIQEALKPLSLHLFKTGEKQIAFYSREIIASTANCPRREDILISLWKDLKMIRNPRRVHLESGLCTVAATTCSIKLASALLELGARADGRGSGLKTPAPLHRAAMKDSLRNARLMRFLLQRGANADITYRKTDGFVDRQYRFKEAKISDEVGTKGLFNWLGKSWEELIRDPWEAN